MQNTTNNVDQQEIDKFNAMVADWWDIKKGSFHLIHKLNPLRVAYIEEQTKGLAEKDVLDIGCGAGILSHALQRLQCNTVTGIDLSEQAILAAKVHQEKTLQTGRQPVNYIYQSTEKHLAQHPEHYDVICCLEMLEHVPEPAQIVNDAANMLKKGGYLIVSTINRTLKAKIFMRSLAEEILEWIPRGTHTYDKFITPHELIQMAEKNGLKAIDCQGYHLNPIKNKFYLNDDVKVNYIITFYKP